MPDPFSTHVVGQGIVPSPPGDADQDKQIHVQALSAGCYLPQNHDTAIGKLHYLGGPYDTPSLCPGSCPSATPTRPEWPHFAHPIPQYDSTVPPTLE